MADTSIHKINSRYSPPGEMGQAYLASGIGLGMRLWQEQPPAEAKPPAWRDYETVGYVIAGRAELHSEGQMVLLEPGDSWVVPSAACLQDFRAVYGGRSDPSTGGCPWP